MKKAFFSFIAVIFSTLVVLAQDGGGKDVNINVNSKGSAWYASPWVWVVGAAVFILLLVALTRGSGRRSD
jgi:phosphoglycerol transferase MdoB-like AlkP superfamily enzyme